MSGCELWQNQIEPYLDGELEVQRLADFEAHLPACPNCLGELESKRWLADQLAALPNAEVSPQFEAQFWARIAREEDAAATSFLARFFAGLRTQWAVPATLVAVLSLWFSLGGPEQNELGPKLASAPALAPTLAPTDWELLTNAEEFELLATEELELFALLDVLEDWDGSEEI